MLGIEEAREREQFNKIVEFKNMKLEDYTFELGYDHCMNMASKIESGMWIFFDQEITKGYGRKFRQL